MKNCKIPKEVLNFLLENGTVAYTDNDQTYAFLPFWFKIVDREASLVDMHLLDSDLPSDLQRSLKDYRYGKEEPDA